MKLEFDIQVVFRKEGEAIACDDQDRYITFVHQQISVLGHEPERVEMEIMEGENNLPRFKGALAHYDISFQFISEDINLVSSEIMVVFEKCEPPEINYLDRTITIFYDFKGIELSALIDDKSYEKRWNK